MNALRLATVCLFVMATPALAAQQAKEAPGQAPSSALGQVGQRQTRGGLSTEAGIEPMGRIEDRIANRVQSRIRNRIDRFYDPQANAVSPFKDAGEESRTAVRNLRR